MTSPPSSPTTPATTAPGRPRTIRIRGVMLAIAVIAAWLAIFREWPWPALAILWLAGPTAFFYAWFKKEAERDEGRPPGPFLRAFLIFSALVISVVLSPLALLAVVFLIGIVAEIASLVSR